VAVRCCPTEAAVNCRVGERSWFSYKHARDLDLLLNRYYYQNCGELNKQDCGVLPRLSFRSKSMKSVGQNLGESSNLSKSDGY